MKRYLPFVVVATLVALAVAFAACSSGSDGEGPGAADGDGGDGPGVSAVCAEGFEDCEDMIVNGEGTAVLCGAGATAPECVAEEPPVAREPGGHTYRVTVDFTEAVTQADIDNVTSIIQSVDPDAEVLILERFPPAASATINTSDGEACAILTEELMNAPGVGEVSCALAVDLGDDPDAPVASP